MKRNWMAFCLAAALMTAGTVYAKPAPSQLVPENMASAMWKTTFCEGRQWSWRRTRRAPW